MISILEVVSCCKKKQEQVVKISDDDGTGGQRLSFRNKKYFDLQCW